MRGIQAALKQTNRQIDHDHYGASFSFRIGSPHDPIAKRTSEALAARLNRDPSRFMVVGDADAVVQRIQEYIDEGCSKFVLLPMSHGSADMMKQTQLVIDEVLPAF